jgi:hypothetical protein
MSSPGEFAISELEERSLHRRLMDFEHSAFADLARLFLDSLVAWLVEINSADVAEEICVEAAEDALVALVKSPRSFDPARKMRLAAFLRMSAQGDLRNILRREGGHRKKCVELSSIDGKYLAVKDDPSDNLSFQDEYDKITKTVATQTLDGLTEVESRVLELIRKGERKTEVFAAVLGIAHRPIEFQRAEVKRVKDKLKRRDRKRVRK